MAWALGFLLPVIAITELLSRYDLPRIAVFGVPAVYQIASAWLAWFLLERIIRFRTFIAQPQQKLAV
jgi:hypothetical protein